MLKESKTSSEIKYSFVVCDNSGNMDEKEKDNYNAMFRSLLSKMTYSVHDYVSNGYDFDGVKTYIFDTLEREDSAYYKRYCADLFKVAYEGEGVTVCHTVHIDLTADQKQSGIWELVYREDISK